MLNRPWPLANDRLTPTKKPLGYTSSGNARRRCYDTPQTLLDGLLAAGVLSPAQHLS